MSEQNEQFDQQGEANDGTLFNIDSPEVVKYKELYPDVNDDAAIGSVVAIYQAIKEGSEVANAVDLSEIIAMINDKLEENTDNTQSEPEELEPVEPATEPVNEKVGDQGEKIL